MCDEENYNAQPLRITVHPAPAAVWGVYNSRPRPTGSTLLQESLRHCVMRTLPHATGAWQPRGGEDEEEGQSARPRSTMGRRRAESLSRVSVLRRWTDRETKRTEFSELFAVKMRGLFTYSK